MMSPLIGCFFKLRNLLLVTWAKVILLSSVSLIAMQDTPLSGVSEEEEKSDKYYAAVLTNTFYSTHKNDTVNKSTIDSFGQTATGRFFLHKKSLYYSFYVSSYPIAPKPKSIQFVDNSGRIIEEQELRTTGTYQQLTDKICGVWKRIPGEFRTALKQEELSVILTWSEYDLKIGGALKKYGPLTTEIFSSLMIAPKDSISGDAAGTAVVSTLNKSPTSVHVMVAFTGLFNFKRKSENLVQLQLINDYEGSVIFEAVINVPKPTTELNVVEYGTAVKSAELMALSQNRVSVVLSLAKYNETRIYGKIVPRVNCELFQAVMSSSHSPPSGPKHLQKFTKASGISWMFIDKDSSLQFFITLDNVPEVSIELVTADKLEMVEDLTSLNLLNKSLSYLKPKYLEQLYGEHLMINVAKTSGKNASLIRGRLVSRPVTDSRDSSTPYLLKRSDMSVPADMVGLIWARIDGECNMHYDVSLAGRDLEDHQYELYLEDSPFQAPGAPENRKLLEDFTGSNVEGCAYGLNQAELIRLRSGVVYLDIWDMKQGQSVLKTKWDKINIPESCLPRTVDNSTADNNIPSYRLNDETDQPPKCFHEGQVYESGAQWTSTKDDCVMCNCNSGVPKCDKIVCPNLNCTKNYTVPGACCPTCDSSVQVTNTTSRNMCSIGGQNIAPGSACYPYMPPNGFDTCIVCRCDVSSLSVQCNKVTCPMLNCDEKLTFHPDPKSCCKICPNNTKSVNYDGAVSDQQTPITSEQDILSAGGCKLSYGGPMENGKEWHPKIVFHGVEKCVKCTCKNGDVRCERKKCTKRSCDDICCMNKEKCIKRRIRQEKIQQ